ncbi:gliding motility-associated-like protein [Pedobacter africanus]|uniref:Gliding motility-associated-like protein n=1 Tax=Pedobacter africanus TaxID=151894 RepID=A0ACC6L3U1_9SPHI|nr:gliding motility-associated C-terminal domain-containing protein [Pedobacter africanus]MDR6786156.1 gliding motility-associated-like protein [Pedobacter africanus]
MTKKLWQLCFIIFLCCFKLQAQTFYVSAPRNPMNITTGSNIYKVTLTPAGLVSELMSTCAANDQFFSIAMNKTGFYWLTSPYLYKSDWSGNTINNCQRFATASMSSSALTVGPDNKLYYSSNNLYQVDLVTGQNTSLGPMQYYPTGDMCFFDGGLYMAASQGIVKVDRNDPSKSFVYLPLSSTLNMFGLVSVATSLHKNTVYGLRAITPFQTDVIEIDIENKQVVGLVGSLPYGVLDAASIVEDGSILGIQLDRIEMYQDCSGPDKAMVEIITKPHLEEFTYVLNGVSNTTGKFTGIAPGTYNVSITSASDQLNTTVTIGSYDLIKPVYIWQTKNETCGIPGEITFTSAQTTYQVRYNNSTFPINHTFTGLSSGNSYHFEILNKNGCKVDAVDIPVLKDICKIELDQVQVQQQCDVYHKGILKVLTKPHTYAYTYTLNGTMSNSTGIFENLAPGQYDIKITSSEDVLDIPAVTVPDYKLLQPLITHSKNNPSCAQKGDIKFSMVGNSNLYKIRYGTSLMPFDHVFDNLLPGVHHFVVLSAAGCLIDEYDVELVYQPCPVVISSIDISPECNVLSKGAIQVNCPPIPETYTYTLNNGMTNHTGIFNLLDPGIYVLTVTASGGGAPQTRTVTVPDYRLLHPNITYSSNNPACDLKGTVKFSIAANSSLYKIRYKTDVMPFDHIFDNLSPGTHHFVVLNQAGCLVDEYDIALVYQPCPVVITDIDVFAECDVLGKAAIRVVCPAIPETYTYTLNNGMSNNTGIFNMLDQGIYEVTVTTSGGGGVQIRSVAVPDFSLNKPTSIVNKVQPVCDLPGQVKFTIKPNPDLYMIRYNSSTYPVDHVFTKLYAGNYRFSILKKNGCIVDDVNIQLLREECSEVFFPTAFSPNHDGVNDIFKANSDSKATNFKIQIYDRRGVLIATSNELHNCWDGNYKGEVMPTAVYFWVATFTTQRNEAVVRKGSVTLIR